MSESIEDLSRVEAWEAALRRHQSRLHDHLQELAELYPEAMEARLGCAAWPLRPLFLPRARLERLAGVLTEMLERTRRQLSERAGEPDALAREVRFPDGVLPHLDLEASLASRHLLSVARPDGFLFPERYIVSELNVGSGLMATLCYTEILYQVLEGSPALRELGWDAGDMARPFPAFLRTLGLQPGSHIALLSPGTDAAGNYAWEIRLYERLLRRHGFTSDFIDIADLVLQQERPTRAGDSRPFDLVLQLTTGESYLSDPTSLAAHPLVAGARVGNAPHVHPTVGLLLAKGLLPWQLSQGLAPSVKTEESFEVTYAQCRYAGAEMADRLRLQKDRFVIKRSWAGKDTVVGCATHGRAWNRAVNDAVDSSRFVVQDYHSLPTVKMPYLLDGRVETIPVNFELSPFLIDGRYSGSLVRYAPEREGVLLSPSPADLGMTLVYSREVATRPCRA